MAWIEVHSNLPDHPKTLYCSDLLHIDPDVLVSKLIRLWTWAIDYRDDGTFLDAESTMIAEKMRWPKRGKKGVQQLMDALCAVPPGESAGFLVKTNTGYAIHNWEKYAGKLLERRKKDRERKRGKNAEPDNNSAGNPNGIQDNSEGNPPEENRNSECYRNPNRNPYPRDDKSSLSERAKKAPEQEPETPVSAALSEIGKIYEATTGSLMPATLAREISFRLAEGADPELLKEALHVSIGRRSEGAYFKAVMQSWTAQGIKNHQQLMDKVQTVAPTVKSGGYPADRDVSFNVGEYVDLSMRRLMDEPQGTASPSESRGGEQTA